MTLWRLGGRRLGQGRRLIGDDRLLGGIQHAEAGVEGDLLVTDSCQVSRAADLAGTIC